ncbi:hypothetical protein NL108_007511 [Boleophthalmus pectinirostris]|nr:hypothetical protein NL108_007511 [Boleophthalmus pectinirostris]
MEYSRLIVTSRAAYRKYLRWSETRFPQMHGKKSGILNMYTTLDFLYSRVQMPSSQLHLLCLAFVPGLFSGTILAQTDEGSWESCRGIPAERHVVLVTAQLPLHSLLTAARHCHVNLCEVR